MKTNFQVGVIYKHARNERFYTYHQDLNGFMIFKVEEYVAGYIQKRPVVIDPKQDLHFLNHLMPMGSDAELFKLNQTLAILKKEQAEIDGYIEKAQKLKKANDHELVVIYDKIMFHEKANKKEKN